MARVKPILFSGEMVWALLAGRKTQTRRVVKDQDMPDEVYDLIPGDMHRCPYGQPGDLLWVRESWRTDRGIDHEKPSNLVNAPIRMEADGSTWRPKMLREPGKLRPSIYMPRWASRLTLRITDIRVARVQDISESDARAEGCHGHPEDFDGAPWCPACRGTGWVACAPDGTETECGCVLGGRKEFRLLWDSINAKRGHGWDVNPWVWAINFEVIQRNVDDVLREEAQ